MMHGQKNINIAISLIFESSQYVSGNHFPIFRSVRL